MIKTKIWVKETEGSIWRLLNTITPMSRFKDVKSAMRTPKNPDPINTEEKQVKAAQEIINGWRLNGPWPTVEFEIEVIR